MGDLQFLNCLQNRVIVKAFLKGSWPKVFKFGIYLENLSDRALT